MNPDRFAHPKHNAPFSSGADLVERDVLAYRQERRRRIVNERRLGNNVRAARNEANHIIYFARISAHFGGSPAEEIFQTKKSSRPSASRVSTSPKSCGIRSTQSGATPRSFGNSGRPTPGASATDSTVEHSYDDSLTRMQRSTIPSSFQRGIRSSRSFLDQHSTGVRRASDIYRAVARPPDRVAAAAAVAIHIQHYPHPEHSGRRVCGAALYTRLERTCRRHDGLRPCSLVPAISAAPDSAAIDVRQT